jgi:hypothetical protein
LKLFDIIRIGTAILGSVSSVRDLPPGDPFEAPLIRQRLFKRRARIQVIVTFEE